MAKVSGATVYPLEFGSALIWAYGYIRVVRRLAASVPDLADPLAGRFRLMTVSSTRR